jgi:hypothetical protein
MCLAESTCSLNSTCHESVTCVDFELLHLLSLPLDSPSTSTLNQSTYMLGLQGKTVNMASNCSLPRSAVFINIVQESLLAVLQVKEHKLDFREEKSEVSRARQEHTTLPVWSQV